MSHLHNPPFTPRLKAITITIVEAPKRSTSRPTARFSQSPPQRIRLRHRSSRFPSNDEGLCLSFPHLLPITIQVSSYVYVLSLPSTIVSPSCSATGPSRNTGFVPRNFTLTITLSRLSEKSPFVFCPMQAPAVRLSHLSRARCNHSFF